MQRPLSIDPQIFLEVVNLSGCRLGPFNGALHSVHNPEGIGFWTMVRVGENMHTRTIEAHLRNLNISQERFLKFFDQYMHSFRG